MSVREALLAILERDGRLDPHVVVDEGRPTSSPLHSHFNWDDATAAEAHRLDQAARLIQRVKVHVTMADASVIVVRAFTNVREPDGDVDVPTNEPGFYVSTETALRVESYRAQLLKAARRDAAAFLAKYQALEELSQVAHQLKNFLDRE